MRAPALQLLGVVALGALVLLSAGTAAGQTALRFDRIGVQDGLPEGMIRSITQDTTGFVWFATGDGLTRWDGQNAVVYRHDPDDPDSISDSYVVALLTATDGALWAGTERGLNRLDPRTGVFERFLHGSGGDASLAAGLRISALAEDPAGRIWIGSRGNGVVRLDPTTGQTETFRYDPEDVASLGGDHVLALAVIGDAVWVGTMAGLDRIDLVTGRVLRVRHAPPMAEGAQGDAVVNAIAPAPNGQLWIGMLDGLSLYSPETDALRPAAPTEPEGGAEDVLADGVWHLYADRSGVLWVMAERGFIRYEPRTGQAVRIQHDPADPLTLPADYALSVYEDDRGSIWVGTTGAGAAVHDPSDANFDTVPPDPNDPAALLGGYVLAIETAPDGTLWVGTRDGGLSRRRAGATAFDRFFHDPDDPGSLNSDFVTSLHRAEDGAVWVGTAAGVARIDPRTDAVRRFVNDPDDPASLAGDRVLGLAELDGAIWVATFAGGLNRLDPETGRVERFGPDPDDPASLPSLSVQAIAVATDGALWLGTDAGAVRHVPGSSRFEAVGPTGDSLVVATIHEDATGALWIGSERGLTVTRPGEAPMSFTTADGLPTNVVRAIESDARGRVWVATSAGLARYVPDGRRGAFEVYTSADGLPLFGFNWRAASRGSDGTLYFGTLGGGLVTFDPVDVAPSTYAAPVVLTGLRVMDEPVHDRPDLMGEVTLGPNRDFFTVEFAALDYAAPERTRFRYRLEGLDADWREATAERPLATYSAVPPGHYEFRVQGTNADGAWSDREARMTVVVRPPWYATWWARLLWGALAASALGAVAVGAHRRKLRAVEQRQLRATLDLTERHLRDKEMILRDVHHRVKNNLQIVASLINLQSDTVEDPTALGALRQMRGRVDALAVVHKRLYSDDSPMAVSAPAYLDELVPLLAQTLCASALSGIEVASDDVRLDASTAVPLGLALAELVANACEHAYRGCDGLLRVSLTRYPASGDGVSRPTVVVAVEDDGCGLPDGMTAPPPGSLGLQLAADLAMQLGGTFEMGRSRDLGGARLALAFPEAEPTTEDPEGVPALAGWDAPTSR